MNFVKNIIILKNFKRYDYNLILVIIHKIRKIIYYKLVNNIINTARLANIIIEEMIKLYFMLNFIICNKEYL